MSTDNVWRDDGACLVCGPDNKSGLHLHFEYSAKGARAEGEVPSHLQGYAGTTHGGIVSAILDEAMYYAVAAQGMPGVATGELTVRYRGPLYTETPFVVEATCERRTRRFAKAKARILSEGRLAAEAEGLFLPVQATFRSREARQAMEAGEASNEDA
ncbi:MAG: PaaI family thioesterase [Thermaerobacter sp.]|nr:PaaI family thioesterase [Thermaerobacter sp.]